MEVYEEQFDIYAKDTAKLLVQEYPWFYLPASVHKILLHGAQVISKALLPIGQLSEEAQEARNKDLKFYREKHTRKVSRTSTNEDLIRALLASSDPLITSLRPLPKKATFKLSQDVLNLLRSPEIGQDKNKEPFAIEGTDESSSSEESSETDEYDNDDVE